jgi:hypothetical protein
MSKTDTMVSYLTRITELKDQLATIGTMVEDQELVSIALKGLVPSWMPFVQGVCAQDTLPKFPKLWVDLVQEEIRLQSYSKQQGEVDVIGLIKKMKKGSKKGYKKKEGTNIERRT